LTEKLIGDRLAFLLEETTKIDGGYARTIGAVLSTILSTVEEMEGLEGQTTLNREGGVRE
jgi:hypothetical protein